MAVHCISLSGPRTILKERKIYNYFLTVCNHLLHLTQKDDGFVLLSSFVITFLFIRVLKMGEKEIIDSFSNRFPGKQRCSLWSLIFMIQCFYLGSKLLANNHFFTGVVCSHFFISSPALSSPCGMKSHLKSNWWVFISYLPLSWWV